jgi:hypothetical protein
MGSLAINFEEKLPVVVFDLPFIPFGLLLHTTTP